MIPISQTPPPTPRGRYRHVAAYRRMVHTLVAAVPTILVLGRLADGPTLRWASYRGHRYSGGAGVGRPTLGLPDCTPMYLEFYHDLAAVFTSAPFVIVLLGGLACTLFVEARKRSGDGDR